MKYEERDTKVSLFLSQAIAKGRKQSLPIVAYTDTDTDTVTDTDNETETDTDKYKAEFDRSKIF